MLAALAPWAISCTILVGCSGSDTHEMMRTVVRKGRMQSARMSCTLQTNRQSGLLVAATYMFESL